MQWIVDGVYLAVAVLFIVGLKAMSSPAKARRGITWAGVGMVLATLVTFLVPGMQNMALIVVAIVLGVTRLFRRAPHGADAAAH